MRVVYLLVCLVLLVGCTPSVPGPSPSAPSPSAVSPTPSRSPSPSPSPSPTAVESFPALPTGMDPEKSAVLEGWQAYELAVDKHKKDPSLTDYRAVEITTGGEETSRVVGAIAGLREKGWRRTGDVVSRFVSIDGPVTSSEGVREALVTYCVEPGYSWTVEIETGKTVVQQDETLLAQVRMQLMPDGSWRAFWYGSEFRPC